jgi:GAF domain-containing protein
MILSKLAPLFRRGIWTCGDAFGAAGTSALEATCDRLPNRARLDGAAQSELDAICHAAREEFGTATALVTLLGQGVPYLAAQSGGWGSEAPISATLFDRAVQTADIVVIPDLGRDPRFAGDPLVTGAPGLRFYAGARLTGFRNLRLGTLCLLDTSPRDLPPAQRDRLARLAAEAADIVMTQAIDQKTAALTARCPKPPSRARSSLQSLPA